MSTVYAITLGIDYEGGELVAVLDMPFAEVKAAVEKRASEWPAYSVDYVKVTEICDGKPTRDCSYSRGVWREWSAVRLLMNNWWGKQG